MSDIANYYKKAPADTKRKIVGSIFPENIEFDAKNYRTKRVNEIFALLFNTDKDFKIKQPGKIAELSTFAPAGLEPATL